VKQNAWRNGIKEVDVTYSANQALAHDYVDEALANWDRIKTEETEVQRLRQVAKAKESIPFSEPLAIEICERVSSGELLINICVDEHMPTVRRVTQWLRENPEFAALYKGSINDRLTIFEEEVIKIADDASRDFRDVVRHGRPARVLDGDAVARAKLRVEVRLIPRLVDQDPWAQLRRPMDMIRQG
jgi:hypothetical protein